MSVRRWLGSGLFGLMIVGASQADAQGTKCLAAGADASGRLIWTDVCTTETMGLDDMRLAKMEAALQDAAQETDAVEESAADPAAKVAVEMDKTGRVKISGPVPKAAAEEPPPGDDESPAYEWAEVGADESVPIADDEGPGQGESRLVWLFSRSNPLTKVEFGTQLAAYAYREPGLMRDRGYFNGFYGTFTYRTSENRRIESWRDIFGPHNSINMFRLKTRFSFGNVDYESEGTGKSDDLDQYLFNIEAHAGYDIPFTDHSRLTPYLGFGWRYLFDDSGGLRTTTGHLGYDREITYAYLPIGMEWHTDFRPGWAFEFTAEYDYLIDGTVKSHLEDVDPGYDTVKNDQKHGFGIWGSLKLIKKGEKLDVVIEPFVRFWKMSASDITAIRYNGQLIPVPGNPGFVLGALEPENKTHEYGVRMGVRY